jgi:anti-sigma factor RsiW
MTSPHEHGSAACREMLERLSEYLDGELTPSACEDMEGHLHDCEPCVAFLRSLKATVAHVESLPRPRLPDDLKRACVEAYARRCRGKTDT